MVDGARAHAVYYIGGGIIQVRLDSPSTERPKVYAAQAQPQAQPTLLAYLEDYADVFSVENASMLPAHGKLDHAIDVTPNSDPPYRPLYNLSQNELAVLRGYLEESTNKG